MNNNTELKFDTVKFITDSNYIIQANKSLFKHNIDIDTGEVISIEFQSQRNPDIAPYKLYISVNYRSGRTVIEFSSKILLSDYPLSISNHTFRQCLQNIESAGICSLDIDGIISDCYFSKLHIVKDIDLALTDAILGRLNQCTGEFRRYKWQRYKEGILFVRDVKAVDAKEALTIYNKEVEISLAKNKTFREKTGNPESILAHFRGKTRFEVQLDNKRKIAKELGIDNTDYLSVMNCRKNIVMTQFQKIFLLDSPCDDDVSIGNFADYGLWNIIRNHNFDIKSIEQEIKDIGLYSNKTKGARGKQVKKIKAMIMAYYHNQDNKSNSVIDDIRDKLENHQDITNVG